MRGVFGVTGGARLLCVSYDNLDQQNAYFQPFTQQKEVTYLLFWTLKGEIIPAALTFPGTWHDSKRAYVSGLYWLTLIENDITSPGYAILGDSAFLNNEKYTNRKVARARNVNKMRNMPISAEWAAIELVLQRLYPSELRTAEWGVRGLRAPFRRLSTTLLSDSGKRGRRLSIACHFANYRTRNTGCSQIRSLYTYRKRIMLPVEEIVRIEAHMVPYSTKTASMNDPKMSRWNCIAYWERRARTQKQKFRSGQCWCCNAVRRKLSWVTVVDNTEYCLMVTILGHLCGDKQRTDHRKTEHGRTGAKRSVEVWIAAGIPLGMRSKVHIAVPWSMRKFQWNFRVFRN